MRTDAASEARASLGALSSLRPWYTPAHRHSFIHLFIQIWVFAQQQREPLVHSPPCSARAVTAARSFERQACWRRITKQRLCR